MGIVVGDVLGVLVLLAIVSVFVLASTRYIGPTQVGLVIKRVGYFDPNRSKATSPGNQL